MVRACFCFQVRKHISQRFGSHLFLIMGEQIFPLQQGKHETCPSSRSELRAAMTYMHWAWRLMYHHWCADIFSMKLQLMKHFTQLYCCRVLVNTGKSEPRCSCKCIFFLDFQWEIWGFFSVKNCSEHNILQVLIINYNSLIYYITLAFMSAGHCSSFYFLE